MSMSKIAWCTDCDYCGNIAMVTNDNCGGKICRSCRAKQEEDFDIPLSSRPQLTVDQLLAEAYGPNGATPPQ